MIKSNSYSLPLLIFPKFTHRKLFQTKKITYKYRVHVSALSRNIIKSEKKTPNLRQCTNEMHVMSVYTDPCH